MQFRTVASGRATLCLWTLVCAIIVFCTQTSGAQTSGAQTTLVIRGARVYPISGPPIEHAVLVIANGKIVAVGEEGKIKIPRGATVEDAAGKVVIPGESKKSLLVAAAAQVNNDVAMPPKRGPGHGGPGGPGGTGGPGGHGGFGPPPKALTAEQVALIRAWIDQGAK